MNLVKQLHDELTDLLREISYRIDEVIGDELLPPEIRVKYRALSEKFVELLEQLRLDLIPSTGKSPKVFSVAIRQLNADILDQVQILKESELFPEVLASIQTALEFPRELLTSAKAKFEPDPPLTARERELLKLLPQGLTSKEMALSLFLTEATIKTHLASIYRKLRVANRVQAIAVALESGLIKSK